MTAPPKVHICDRPAERLVLCGALKAPDLTLAPLIERGVTAEAFGVHCHRLVWTAVVDLLTSWCDVDLVSVYDLMRWRKQLPELGPRPGLWFAEVWEEDPTGAWALGAAEKVLRAQALRAQAHRAIELLGAALRGDVQTEVPRTGARHTR